MKKTVTGIKNIFLLATIIIVTLPFSSCKKFLHEVSPNDVSGTDMFQDANSLENARIGLYNTLQNVYYYGAYFPLMVDAYSDNGQTGGYDSPALEQLGNKTLTSDNIYVENTWIAIYNTIYTANQIITHVDGIDDPTLSDELRNDIKGEAFTIRALAHFDLLRMFGEHWDLNSQLGIPVVDHIAAPDEFIGRSSVAETYDFIITDLTTALDLVSNDDYRLDPPSAKGSQFITLDFVNALLARVYQSKGDLSAASSYADAVINTGTYSLVADVNEIYSSKFSAESIFELTFSQQDKSQYNAATYARPDALRSDVLFLAAEDLNTFFSSRPVDQRTALVDFVNNDLSIEPDGRTQKYRGEALQDNDFPLMRIAEMYLIRAESNGIATGLADLNLLRITRGAPALTVADVVDEQGFRDALYDERRAEFNFEGQRYFDLAHLGEVENILGVEVLPVFPIPLREVTATGGVIEQYPGYE